TTIGAVPPTRTGPMDTCTDLRRWMEDMVPAGERASWDRGFYMLECAHPIMVCPERVRPPPERRRRKLRPETLRHTNGRSRGLWRVVDALAATHRRGAAPQAPDLSGHRTEGGKGHPTPCAVH